MGELYHGRRIFNDSETNEEIIAPISFKYDDILDIRGSRGSVLPFTNTDNKVYVRLTCDRGMWIIERVSVFRKLWEAYLDGDYELNTDPDQFFHN